MHFKLLVSKGILTVTDNKDYFVALQLTQCSKHLEFAEMLKESEYGRFKNEG